MVTAKTNIQQSSKNISNSFVFSVEERIEWIFQKLTPIIYHAIVIRHEVKRIRAKT